MRRCSSRCSRSCWRRTRARPTRALRTRRRRPRRAPSRSSGRRCAFHRRGRRSRSERPAAAACRARRPFPQRARLRGAALAAQPLLRSSEPGRLPAAPGGVSVRGEAGPLIVVGDLSQPRGGPTPSGHRSHQTGLDADVGFVAPAGARAGRLSAAARESLSPPAVVDAKTHEKTPAWTRDCRPARARRG